MFKEAPACPQCKAPFNYLYTHRLLDGTMSDFPVEESVCLLRRARWFEEHHREREKGKAAMATPAAARARDAAAGRRADAGTSACAPARLLPAGCPCHVAASANFFPVRGAWCHCSPLPYAPPLAAGLHPPIFKSTGGDWADFYEDYEQPDEDEEVEAFYFSSRAGRARITLGNRRLGENGYMQSGALIGTPTGSLTPLLLLLDRQSCAVVCVQRLRSAHVFTALPWLQAAFMPGRRCMRSRRTRAARAKAAERAASRAPPAIARRAAPAHSLAPARWPPPA